MNIKAIVKVMNFHAIIRVEKAHRQADKYLRLEKEVARMIDIIENNRNFILDKRVFQLEDGAGRLRIYIGSDLGFCGAVNASVNQELAKEDPNNTIIVIGKKIHDYDFIDFNISRDEFESRYPEIQKYFYEAVHERKYSGIDIFYDHYYNMSHIEPMSKTIFPVHFNKDEYKDGAVETYREDFFVEGGNVDTLIENLFITYLNYELKSAAVNAFASENILRQNATNQSLKKIEEKEVEARWEEHKLRGDIAAKRIQDSFTKNKYREKKEH